MKPILLIAHARSGSWMLSSALNSHPDIKDIGEIFSPQSARPYAYYHFSNDLFKKDALKQPNENKPYVPNTMDAFRQFVESVSEIDGKISEPKFGIFNIKYGQINALHTPTQGLNTLPGALRVAKEDGYKLIHLTRKNILKTYVSLLKARKTKSFRFESGQDGYEEHKKVTVNINKHHVVTELNKITHDINVMRKVLSDNFDNVVELEYEDILAKKDRIKLDVLKKLVKLLGLPAKDFHNRPWLKKQTPDDLSIVIENYDDVKERLEKSKFSWMI